VADAVEVIRVSRAFDDARSRFPDFDEWKPQMAELYKLDKYRELGPHELYQLAKATNPEEVTKRAEAKKEREAAEKSKNKFGGFRPSTEQGQKQTQPVKAAKGTDVAQSAVERAYANLFADRAPGDSRN
jgi:hypothetical protein